MLLASLNNSWVRYSKLNGTGSTSKLEPTHSIFNYLGELQALLEIKLYDANIKHEWQIQIPYIFLLIMDI